MNIPVTRTPILDTGDPEAKRAEILDYFHKTYDVHERLYDVLKDDDAFYLRPEPLRHPLIFYFGHTASFFINKLVISKIIDQRVNPRFESIFAIGVDEMSWDDLNEAHYDWPSMDEVRAYRGTVRTLVDDLIKTMPMTFPIGWDHPFWIILMGIEHERIHLETSSVIIRQMDMEHINPDPYWELCPHRDTPAPQNELLPVPGGTVVLGKPKGHRLYGWDNEYGRHKAEVKDFNASKYLVSNKEFLAFVDDGGYQTEDWWTEEGWNWVQYTKARHPLWWIPENDGYKYRAFIDIIDMPWSWPVDVNQLEAKAFCNWMGARSGKSLRLPTEDEWYRLRDMHKIPDQPDWDHAPGNINLEHWASSCPVDHFRFGDFHDIAGNVWQWTEIPISGFPGFAVHPSYDDFSTPTFDSRHNLIKGGSWISTGNEATRDARYAFRRHFFQHAGFRYVESSEEIVIQSDYYETDAQIAQYCEAHYGGKYHGVANFPATCAGLCIDLMRERRHERAMDLGCAVGRTTFELARMFDSVTGVDFSARFIRVGVELKERGYVRYVIPEEGELLSYREASLDKIGLDEVRGKVEFWQGDAINLKPQFTDYDLIFCGNLLDRLYDPGRFLAAIHERLRVGGLLVLASPYTWLEEFTPRDHWIGGFKKDGEPFTTLDGLRERLAGHFRMIGDPSDIPFVIRETRRKFQHTSAEITAWERVE